MDNVDQGMIRTIKSLINPPSKILEISCGNAMDSIHLQGLGYDIKCTELDPKYVKNAQDLGLDCIQHNTQDRFPFENGEFDLVYCRLGLHYFSKPDLSIIFDELYRICNRHLVFSVKIAYDNLSTGKVILDPEDWIELVRSRFTIVSNDIKVGNLYGSDSKWIEIVASI